MLEVKGLKKSYGDVQALKGVSFNVKGGVVFGLLGPNGAGKTTTFRIISTLLSPDEGEVFWNGKSVFENKRWWKKKMGYVPQELAVYGELTGLENCILMAELYGLKGKDARKRSIELIEGIGLYDKMSHKVKNYSGGMKRRLNLIMGLIHNPDIILLDEPTAGIDVQTKMKIYGFIKELVAEGKTVLYTTHMLKEAEEIFDIVGIIDEGLLKAIGSVDRLIEEYAPFVLLELRLKNTLEHFDFLSSLGEFDSEKGFLKLKVPSQSDIAGIIERLNSRGVTIDNMIIKGASLETVFLNLTGRELRD